ncbi:MAG TPA: hypothetical protein VKE94_16550, partial [Gemmataceae bacterium]|nr:hypothetical protein [Gemmataceae bacterium]
MTNDESPKNDEAPMTNDQARSPNDRNAAVLVSGPCPHSPAHTEQQITNRKAAALSSFVLRHSSVLRHSCFVILQRPQRRAGP